MPVKKRSLRGKRYAKLRRWGFIEEEALEFSKRPELLKTPYFQKLRNQRLIQINNIRSKLKPGQPLTTDSAVYRRYVARIKESYKKNDWFTQKVLGSRNRPVKRLIPLFLDPGKLSAQTKRTGRKRTSNITHHRINGTRISRKTIS